MSEIVLKIRAMPQLTEADIKKATSEAEKTFKPTVHAKIMLDADTGALKSTMADVHKLVESHIHDLQGKELIPAEKIRTDKVKGLENAFVSLKARIKEAYASGNPLQLHNELKSVESQFRLLSGLIRETFNTDELATFVQTFGELSQENLMKDNVSNIRQLGNSLENLKTRCVEIRGEGERVIKVYQTLNDESGIWEQKSMVVSNQTNSLTTQMRNLRVAMESLSRAGGEGTTGDSARALIEHLDKINPSAVNAREQIQQLKMELAELQKQYANSNTPLEVFKRNMKEYVDLLVQQNKLERTGGSEEEVNRIKERVKLLREENKNIQDNILNQHDRAEADVYAQEQLIRGVQENEKFNESLKKQSSLLYNIQQGWREATARIVNYTTIYRALWKIVEVMRDAVKTAEDLNTAFNDIQMVTLYSKQGIHDLAEEYSDMAYELSTSLTSIAQGSSEWLRQGRSLEETSELLRASTVMARVGQLQDTESTQYLTSALKGYKIAAEDAMHVVDALSEVDMRSASSVGELAEAMQRTANVAAQSGVDFERLIGYLGTMKDVSQRAAPVVGEAMKTILSRIGSVAAGKFLDEDLENEYEDFDTYVNDVEKALGKVGLSLRDTNLQFRDAQDILDDVASKWSQFSDLEKNALSTAFGGTRQRELFLVLMSNYTQALDLSTAALESNGAAMQKYSVYQDSIAARQERLTAIWQGFVSSAGVEELIKDFLSLSEVLMKLVLNDDILIFFKNFGAAILTTVSAFKVLKTALNSENFSLSLSSFAPKNLGETFKNLKGYLYDVKIGADSLTKVPLSSWLGLVASAAMLAYTVFKKFYKSSEELKQEIQGLGSEIEQNENDIKSYQDGIDSAAQRIKELQRLADSGTISVVEQEELDKLKLENKELENNVLLLRERNKLKRQQADEDATELYNRYYSENKSKSGNAKATAYMTNLPPFLQQQLANTVEGPQTPEEELRNYVDKVNELESRIVQAEDPKEIQKLIEMRDTYRQKAIEQRDKLAELVNGMSDDNELKAPIVSALNYYMDSLSQIEEKADEILSDSRFENVTAEMKRLAEAGELTAEALNDTRFDGLKSELSKLGLDVDWLVEKFNVAADDVAEAAGRIASIDQIDMTEKLRDNVGAVGEALAEFTSTGYLSQDMVNKLTAAGYNLDDMLTLTENGYLTTRDAILALVNAQRTEYQEAVQNSLRAAAELVGAKINEKDSYDAVTNAILAKIKAQMLEAEASAKASYANFMSWNKSGNKAKAKEASDAYNAAMSTWVSLQQSRNNLTTSLSNLDRFETSTAYWLNQKTTSRGSGGGGGSRSSSSSSSDKVESKYEKEIRILEHRQFLADQWAKAYEGEADKSEQYQAKINEQVEIYGRLMATVHEEANRLRLEGYDDESKEIQELQKKYWDYYQKRKDMMDDIEDYRKKLQEEREKEEKEERDRLKDLLSDLRSAIGDLMDEAQDRLDKMISRFDYQIARLEAMKNLTQKYYDSINEVGKLQHEIDKDLAKSKSQYAYIDETLRDTIFNDKDYAKLSDKLQGIARDCETLYNNYLQDLSNLTEDEIYKADIITQEYERQYQYKMMEYQVANAELNLIRAQTNLQETLANRNVRMFQNGQWTWVADHEKVADAQEQLEEAKYDYRQAQIGLRQQAVIDSYDRMIEQIEAQKGAANAQFNALKAQWEIYQKQLSGEADAMTRILKIINENDLPEFQAILQSLGGGFTDFLNSLNGFGSAVNSLASGLSSGLGGSGTKSSSVAKWPNNPLHKDANRLAYGDLSRDKGYAGATVIQSQTNTGKGNLVSYVVTYNDKGYAVKGKTVANNTKEYSAIKRKQLVNSGTRFLAGKKYDSGGVLEGLGGIKATRKDETVFDEKISSMLLSPQKSQEFLNSAEALSRIMGNSYGLSRIMGALDGAVNSSGITNNDSHNIVLNGDIVGRMNQGDYDSISSILKRYIPIMKG